MIPKKIFLKFFFPILAVLVLVFLLVSRALYTGTMDDIWDTISTLGDSRPDANPNGAIYFQLAMGALGLLLLLAAIDIHPRMTAFQKGWTRVGTLWLIIGSVGFLLMCFISRAMAETIASKFHEICAGVGALGVLLAVACYDFAQWTPGKFKPPNKLVAFIVGFFQMIFGITGIFYLIDWIKATKGQTIEGMNKKLRIIIDIVFLFTIFAIIITFGIAEFYYKEIYPLGWYGPDWGTYGVPFIYSFSFWERVIFADLTIYPGLLIASMPEK
jgi:hypothetical protein